MFEIFFHLGLDILHEDEISEDMLLGCDDTTLVPHDEESCMIEEHISQQSEDDHTSDKCDGYMEHLGTIESDIAHIIDELGSESHGMDIRGLFGEFCEYDEAFESGTDRPAGHE